MPRRSSLLLVLMISTGLCGCTDSAPPATPPSLEPPPSASTSGVRFEGASKALGIDFFEVPEEADRFFFPAIMSGGAVLDDLSGDQRIDILLLKSSRQGTRAPGSRKSVGAFFLQSEDGTFQRQPDDCGLQLPAESYATGCTTGDINNDGLNDVYVTAWGPDELFLNLGQGRFQPVAESAGISNPGWGTSAALLDFNRDGWLDLFVTNYVEYDPGHACQESSGRQDFCNPAVFPRTSDRLFLNTTGESGSASRVRFRDVTLESGIGAVQGAGLGVVSADFNQDSWPDLYVANDGHANIMWINQRDGTFQDQAVLLGTAVDFRGLGQGSMGIAVSDLNGDLSPDLLVTNLDGESNALYLSNAVGYQDVSNQSGLMEISFPRTGFGTVLMDAENDGDSDLFVVNGRVRRSAVSSVNENPNVLSNYGEQPSLLLNTGGFFAEGHATSDAFSRHLSVARSLCSGDVNQDGAVDLLLTSLDQAAVVFLNRSEPRGHWLRIRLTEPSHGHRNAIGATATVRCGKRIHRQWLTGGGSYQCASEPCLHFGLREVTSYDSIEVLWPDGSREQFPGGTADVMQTLNHGQGKLISP